MTFLDWIERSGMRAARVAELLGISAGHLHDLTHGRTWPSRDIALRIRTLTHGEVTPNDFLPPMRQSAETIPQKRKAAARKKAARPLLMVGARATRYCAICTSRAPASAPCARMASIRS